MPARLTQREKQTRGTAQRCRAREARSLSAIRRDIRELRQIITDMHFNIDLARKSIRADGCLIEILVANSNGRLEKTRRVNPSFRVQADALKMLKGLSRRKELLEEELDAAATKQKKEEEVSEFSI